MDISIRLLQVKRTTLLILSFVLMATAVSTILVPRIGRAINDSDIVAVWKCEETSGVRYNSASTTLNSLTDNNTVTYTTGMDGNACYFTRANSEYLSATDASLTGIDLNSPFTISMWVNLASYPSDYAVFLDKGTKAFFIQNNGGTYRFKTDMGSGWENNTTFSTDWTLITIVNDADSVRVYFNDTMQVDDAGATTDNTSSLFIGAYTGPQFYFDGAIDEILWFDIALTDADVVDLYNGGAGLFYPFTVTSTTSTSIATTTSSIDVSELKWVLELYLAIFMFLLFTWLGYRFTKIFI